MGISVFPSSDTSSSTVASAAKSAVPTGTIGNLTTTPTLDTAMTLTMPVVAGQVVQLHVESGAGGNTSSTITPYLYFSGATLGAYDAIGEFWTPAGVHSCYFGYGTTFTTGVAIFTNPWTTPTVPMTNAFGLLSFNVNLSITSAGTLSVSPGWASSTASNWLYARTASVLLVR